MGVCARAAPALLSHVNLLITVYAGAALATAARLKWDPSTYVVVRELLPLEYRAAAAALTAGGAAALLLPQLGAAALHATRPRARRLLLYVYAGVMCALMACEAVFAWWLVAQLWAWLSSPAAQQLSELLELRAHVRPLLRFLARWHPLPQHLERIIQEAEEDVPRNLVVVLALGVLLALLQLLASALALLAARASLAHDAPDQRRSLQPQPPPYSGSSYEYKPLPIRTAYRNGRIVIL